MTTREKIAHLYRRLGFGATPAEIDAGVKLGVKETARRLIDFDSVDEGFPVSPIEFTWRDKDQPDLNSYHYRQWWVMRMLATHRPLQERLTLFWHNHFAVSDSKVDDGPMMMDYLTALRSNCAGNFVDLLKAVSKNPAMMRYLDMQRSMRGNPNENFPREVMELFTLGIGNYSEQDVKEASRAFTGWGYLRVFNELPGDTTQKVNDWLSLDRPFSAFIEMPAMHDPTPKTLLGRTAEFNGDLALEHLSEQPATRKRIAKKLWEFFAFENPDEKSIDRLVKVWQRTNGNVRAMIHAIVDSPEFWSDRCVRKLVKSPVDFCVGIARQMGAGPRLMELRGADANEHTKMNVLVTNNLGGILNRMDKCGLRLLFPPDVSGWRWGQAWITPAAMIERYRYRGMFIRGPKGADVGTTLTLDYVKSRRPKTSQDVASALADYFDVGLPPPSIAIVAEALDTRGGIKALDNPNTWSGALDRMMTFIVAAPETHFC